MIKYKIIPGEVVQEFNEELNTFTNQFFNKRGKITFEDKNSIEVKNEHEINKVSRINLSTEMVNNIKLDVNTAMPSLNISYRLIKDKYEWKQALAGGDALHVINTLQEEIRSKLKYSPTLSTKESAIYESIQEYLNELVYEYNIGELI